MTGVDYDRPIYPVPFKESVLEQTDPIESARGMPDKLGVRIAKRDDGDLFLASQFYKQVFHSEQVIFSVAQDFHCSICFATD